VHEGGHIIYAVNELSWQDKKLASLKIIKTDYEESVTAGEYSEVHENTAGLSRTVSSLLEILFWAT